MFNRSSSSKNEPKTKVKSYIYCVNQLLGEKLHKNETKKANKNSLKFCNIFNLLTPRTQKIAW